MATSSLQRSYLPLIVGAVVALGACGSSGGTASGTASGSASNPSAQAAVQTTKTYTDHPSPFPVDAPLPRRLPPGTNFGFLQCVAPVCAQLAGLITEAVKVLHGNLTVVKAGPSAQQLQSAMSSLLEKKPTALILPAIQPALVRPQLQQAQAAGIPISSTGIMDTQPYGIDASAFGKPLSELAGKLQADWVVANKGVKNKIVFYTTKELDFFPPEEAAFRAELKTVGCDCSVRTVDIPISTYGSSAPSLVVSDLQSHPDTTIAVFGANDPTTGLVAAMRGAGLKTPYIGYGPTPSNLVDITNHSQPAGLGLDYPVLGWTLVDEAARLILKAPLSAQEQQSFVPTQWLTADNLQGADISKGWTGYPDYVSRFTKLWTVQ